MLRPALRTAFGAIRASGWRAPALAFLGYLPVGVASAVDLGFGILVVAIAQMVVLLALVRVLGAYRPVPLPPIPQVDDQGRRVLPAARPVPPVGDEDRSPAAALRAAGKLLRPSISLVGLHVLVGLAAVLSAIALSGGKIADYSPAAQRFGVLPMGVLFATFVALAPQRVALEGDPRVLVAAAHSVRIARRSYGLLLLLTVFEPLLDALSALALPGENPPAGRIAAVVAVVVVVGTVTSLLTTAVANELYLAGPRLELPLEAER